MFFFIFLSLALLIFARHKVRSTNKCDMFNIYVIMLFIFHIFNFGFLQKKKKIEM